MRRVLALSLAWLVAASPVGSADAAPASDAPGARAGTGAPARGKAMRWLTAVTPRRHVFEPGFFGGLWLPSRAIELHDRNILFLQYEKVSSELGLRLGYYPLRHFGFEGELAMMPGRTTAEQRAFVSSARANAVLQLGLSRVVPFAVIGGGVVSVRSEDDAAGDDADQALTVGGGVKVMLTPHIVVRLDVRDVMTPKRGIRVNDPADNVEVLFGFSLALGPRKKKEAAKGPADLDADGVADDTDACPTVAARTSDGCPRLDADDDGFEDRVDACPKEAGAAPDGCPIPDTDGDGFLDPDDACVDEAGVAPEGCAIRDDDGDGMLAPQDACPTEAETGNGWQDADGCPDELPADVQAILGVLDGVAFAAGRATLPKAALPRLDEVVEVLKAHPDLRVRITAHTDDRGAREKNLEVSLQQADAVKAYITGAGVDPERVQTRGAGPDEPREAATTSAARKANRRVELDLVTSAPAPAPTPEPSEPAPSEPAPEPEPAPEAAPAPEP
jgi:outer membrane protein OmpA-like peptidoglycan-associated protein/opacity protein-like surface antigen